jgi:RNA polymerase sigma factor (sigma-70 family)
MSTSRDDAAANGLLRTMICHRATLVSVANRILRCRHLAEDVVQDAALKACQIEAGAAPECPLRFSCSVVRNLAIDRARRCALERRHAAPAELGDDVAATGDDPLHHVESRQALDVVLAALAELPTRTRMAFEMHRFHDVPQKNIAVALGVSPTLVNFMIRDAQNLCRQRLEEGGVLPPFAAPDVAEAAAKVVHRLTPKSAIPVQSAVDHPPLHRPLQDDALPVERAA